MSIEIGRVFFLYIFITCWFGLVWFGFVFLFGGMVLASLLNSHFFFFPFFPVVFFFFLFVSLVVKVRVGCTVEELGRGQKGNK